MFKVFLGTPGIFVVYRSRLRTLEKNCRFFLCKGTCMGKSKELVQNPRLGTFLLKVLFCKQNFYNLHHNIVINMTILTMFTSFNFEKQTLDRILEV